MAKFSNGTFLIGVFRRNYHSIIWSSLRGTLILSERALSRQIPGAVIFDKVRNETRCRKPMVTIIIL